MKILLIALALLFSTVASAAEYADIITKGESLIEKRQFEAALALADSAIELDPAGYRGYVIRGMAKEALKQDVEACEAWDTVISLKPEYAEAYLRKGMLLMDAQDVDSLDPALGCLNKAIELAPKSPRVYLARSMFRAKFKDWTGAIKDINTAIRLNPKEAFPYYCLATAKEGLGDFTGAINACNTGLAIKKDGYGYYVRGAIKYYSMKDKKGAIADLSLAGELGYAGAYAVLSEIQSGR